MAYVINAWLDCPHPYLKVINSISGREVLAFEEQELKTLLENGDLCVNDLLTTNQSTLEEVVRQLALYRCSRSLLSQGVIAA